MWKYIVYLTDGGTQSMLLCTKGCWGVPVQLLHLCRRSTCCMISSVKCLQEREFPHSESLAILVSSGAAELEFSHQKKIKKALRSLLSEAKNNSSHLWSNLLWCVWLHTSEHPVYINANQEEGLSSCWATSSQLSSIILNFMFIYFLAGWCASK